MTLCPVESRLINPSGGSSGKNVPAAEPFARDTEGLNNLQLTAILVSTGPSPTSGDLELANRLMARFGHPSRLDRASQAELLSVGGMGKGRALRIKAALELGRRSLAPPDERPRLTNSREVASFFLPRIGHREVEIFCCALLDTRNRVIRDVTVATGTVNACFIHPREVYRAAISESACAVVLVHNHPSGDVQPSDEDLSLTKRVMEAGTVIGIKVLDHVIVGAGGYFSFLDTGMLTR
jgi:DNA repair protein RadC